MREMEEVEVKSMEPSDSSVVVRIELALLRPGEQADDELFLLQREVWPDAGRFALPGGELDALDATLEAAARRVAHATAGLLPAEVLLVGAFGDRERDSRARTVSLLYLAFVPTQRVSNEPVKSAGACWFPLSHLPSPLALDHDRLVRALLAVEDLRYRAVTGDEVSRKAPPVGLLAMRMSAITSGGASRASACT